MNDFTDATQLREAVVRHYRDPHAGTIPGTADVLLRQRGLQVILWVSFSPWKPPQWSEHASTVLGKSGHRWGAARIAVVDVLASHSCCLTARDIADELRARGERTGIASVYRALDLLHDLGLVKRLDVGDGTARYEPADPSGEHHHHLVCDRCGSSRRSRTIASSRRSTRCRGASTTRSTRMTSCFAAPARTAAPPRRRHSHRRRRAA